MKIKEGFVLREIAGTHVVVPIGQNVVELSIMMTLNDSGAFLWKHLTTGIEKEPLIQNLMTEYGIDLPTAVEDVEDFMSALVEKNLVD